LEPSGQITICSIAAGQVSEHVVWDARKCVGEPKVAFDAAEFGCFDQGLGDGCGLVARRLP